MSLALRGKTAIVTGASSGISLAFARALLLKECNVLFADLELLPEAKQLVASHSSRSGSNPRAAFQRTDVKRWSHLKRMFWIAEHEFGGADIVCPGAGIYEPPTSSFWHPPGKSPSLDTDSYATLDTNLIHPIRTTQLALSHFLSTTSLKKSPTFPSNPKSIIHISSIAGQATSLVNPIYNATKHGINGFVRSLAALEPQLGICVTAVAPGVIRTPLSTQNPEKLELLDDASDTWVSPEVVAEVMLRLAEGGEMLVGRSEAEEGTGGETNIKKKTVQVAGGLILEVADRIRVVEQFGDPGPSHRGVTLSRTSQAQEGILGGLVEGWGNEDEQHDGSYKKRHVGKRKGR